MLEEREKMKRFLVVFIFMIPVLSVASTEGSERLLPKRAQGIGWDQSKNPDPIKQVNGNPIAKKQENKEPKQQTPFFWKIERNGKKSYILGTLHKGISFEELPYHEEIKDYLRESDLLLKETSKNGNIEKKPRLLTEKTRKIIAELNQRIKISETKDWTNEILNLSQQELDFLVILWREDYFKKHGSYPNKEDIQGSFPFLHPSQLVALIQSSAPKIKIKASYDSSKQLDKEVEDYFLQYKKQAISFLEDLETESLINQTLLNLITMKDVKEWIENYSKRFSQETIIKNLNHLSSYHKKMDRMYLSGEFNEEDLHRTFLEIDLLETEIRYEEQAHILNLDFRNQLWVPKIISAFEQHDSIFIMAGLAHFIRQKRNPSNIPELEKYTKQNKDLPTNVLDMLKKESFKITRFGEGDFIPATPCQRAFL